MYRNLSDIGPEYFKIKSHRKLARLLWIITGIFILIALIDIIFFGGITYYSFRDELSTVILNFCLAIIIPVGIFALGFTKAGSYNQKSKINLLNEVGLEGALNEIHNDAICVIRNDKGYILTVITPRHFFDLSYGIYSTDNIDYSYNFNSSGNGRINIYTLDGRSFNIGYGMPLNGIEEENVNRALRMINPNILIGYSSENKQEHKRRVEAFNRIG